MNMISKQINELDFGISASDAKEMKESFSVISEKFVELEKDFNTLIEAANNEVTVELCEAAKRMRLDTYQKIRLKADEIHKGKAESLIIKKRALDGIRNIFRDQCHSKEVRLKKIEKHFQIQEQKKRDELQESRAEELRKLDQEYIPSDLFSMSNEVWTNYIFGVKKAQEEKIAAEKRAEEERIARQKQDGLRTKRQSIIYPYIQFHKNRNIDFGELSEEEFKNLLDKLKSKKSEFEKEQKRIKAENEKFKKQQEEAEKKAKLEAEKRAKEDADRKKKEEAERKAREEKEKAEREAYEAKLKAEREEKERIQRELKQREEADRKAKEEAERLQEAKLKASDTEKIESLISELDEIGKKYQFKSKRNNEKYENLNKMIHEDWIPYFRK